MNPVPSSTMINKPVSRRRQSSIAAAAAAASNALLLGGVEQHAFLAQLLKELAPRVYTAVPLATEVNSSNVSRNEHRVSFNSDNDEGDCNITLWPPRDTLPGAEASSSGKIHDQTKNTATAGLTEPRQGPISEPDPCFQTCGIPAESVERIHRAVDSLDLATCHAIVRRLTLQLWLTQQHSAHQKGTGSDLQQVLPSSPGVGARKRQSLFDPLGTQVAIPGRSGGGSGAGAVRRLTHFVGIARNESTALSSKTPADIQVAIPENNAPDGDADTAAFSPRSATPVSPATWTPRLTNAGGGLSPRQLSKLNHSGSTSSMNRLLIHHGSTATLFNAPDLIHTTKTELVEDDDDLIQINDYTIIDEAGRGQFGLVKIAVKQAPDEKVYAIKIVAKRRVRAMMPQHGASGRARRRSQLLSAESTLAAGLVDGVLQETSGGTAPPPGSSSLTSAEQHPDSTQKKLSTPHTSHLAAAIGLHHHSSLDSATKLGELVNSARTASTVDTALALPTDGDYDEVYSPLLPGSLTGFEFPKGAGPSRKEVVDEVRREIEVMKTLRHRNIVNLLEVIDDPEDTNLYLVMPYCDRGPIVTLSKEGTCAPLDVDVARGYMRQITAGLAYLHSKHVAHMDIKPDNILLDSSHTCYLSDFGTSEFFEGEFSVVTGLRGTPAFAAPETTTSDTFDPFEADVWSLGVTFYVMLYGRLPFIGETFQDLTENIRTAPLKLDLFPEGADPRDYEDANDLLEMMLAKNPSARPTVVALRNHMFITPQRHNHVHLTTKLRGSIEHAKRFQTMTPDELASTVGPEQQQ